MFPAWRLLGLAGALDAGNMLGMDGVDERQQLARPAELKLPAARNVLYTPHPRFLTTGFRRFLHDQSKHERLYALATHINSPCAQT
jgi:hypothetical protein